MIQIIRGLINSKIGIAVALGFVVLIMLSFAAGDISSFGGLGSQGGGNGAQVAKAGDESISAAELEQQVRNTVDNIRRENPQYTMKRFLDEEDGVSAVLGELIDRAALQSFGDDHGIVAGPALVGRELARVPAFQGLDGKFSEAAYRQVLQQRGFNDETVRGEFAQRLIARQLLIPAQVGAEVAPTSVLRYAQILTERRQGEIGLLPAVAFAPKGAPSEAEVAAWYKANQKDYMLPERRVIRYAVFDDSAVKQVPAPTEAEIEAVFKKNAAVFAASETRSVTQLILPTEAAARAVLAEVSAGKSLDSAASTKGLTAARLTKLTRDSLSGQASKEVSDATFAAARGAMAGPVKSPLGWHLMRVDSIESKAARTLEQARPEIVVQLAIANRRKALTDFSAGIEDEFDNGAALGDVAKELGLTLNQTEPLTANGQVFGKPGVTAPPVLAKVLQTAFAMEGEGQPQLAEIEPGKTFVVYDIAALARAAPAPLAAIAPRVAADVQTAKGANAARAAAQKVEAMVRKGTDLAQALASLGVALPPPQKIDMPRQQLQAMGQQVPPALRLFFAMGKGSVKLYDLPRGQAWYVLHVANVIPGEVKADAPQLAPFALEMRQVIGREYADALTAAIKKDVGVKRDDAAIRALATRLKGG